MRVHFVTRASDNNSNVFAVVSTASAASEKILEGSSRWSKFLERPAPETRFSLLLAALAVRFLRIFLSA